MNQKQTPLMRQYWDIKSSHPDKVLLFRMGDFFELFHDDAVKAAPILGIALTRRNQKAADETPMCGVPHHSIGNYINKLLRADCKVAICDQVEDPKFAKGLVKRAVTRILSPGMVFDPDTLDQFQPNYLCAFNDEHVAFLDASTGEAFYFFVQEPREALRVINILSPKEIILASGQFDSNAFNTHKTKFDELVGSDLESTACRRLRAYVQYMQGGRLDLPIVFEERRLLQRLELTPNTVRHLELFETNRGEPKGSLFSSVNKTRTPGGARKLRSWLAFPMAAVDQITKRQNEIAKWIENPDRLAQVRDLLTGVGDLERRATRITNANSNARDLVHFCDSLKNALSLPLPTAFQTSRLQDICREIHDTIVDEPPHSVRDGHMIKRGRLPELDRLIEMTENSQELIVQLEQKEKQRTGISSLKIKFNNVFGYSIEITNTHKATKTKCQATIGASKP
jgi:DNA mismatch repair protein MutS